MNILMGLVIAMFIITAAYVGYHAMQQSQDEGEEHSIEFELLNENTGIIQAFHKTTMHKAFI